MRDPEHVLGEVIRAVQADEMGLAEGVRRVVALRNGLDPGHPLRRRLEIFGELDAAFDLARAGYGELDEVTVQMRQAFASFG
jgi:hypothetical protein